MPTTVALVLFVPCGCGSDDTEKTEETGSTVVTTTTGPTTTPTTTGTPPIAPYNRSLSLYEETASPTERPTTMGKELGSMTRPRATSR